MTKVEGGRERESARARVPTHALTLPAPSLTVPIHTLTAPPHTDMSTEDTLAADCRDSVRRALALINRLQPGYVLPRNFSRNFARESRSHEEGAAPGRVVALPSAAADGAGGGGAGGGGAGGGGVRIDAEQVRATGTRRERVGVGEGVGVGVSIM